jgi:hypothetical protein
MGPTYFITYSEQRPTWLFSIAIEAAPTVLDPIQFVKRNSSRFAVASLENRLVATLAADGIEPLFHLGHAFAPASWIAAINPAAKQFCRRFEMPSAQVA